MWQNCFSHCTEFQDDDYVGRRSRRNAEEFSEYKCTLQLRGGDPEQPIFKDDPLYNVNDTLSEILPDIYDVCVDLEFPDKCLTKRPDDAEDVGDGNWEVLPSDHSYYTVSVQP